LSLVVTPCARQSGEFLRNAKEFVRKLGMRVQGDLHNMLSIALPNGSRIVGLPENETTVRGFSDVSLLLIDEATRVSDEIYRAMRPTLVTHNIDLWLMSTPNGKRVVFPGRMGPRGRGMGAGQRAGDRLRKDFAAGAGAEKATAGEPWHRQEYLCEFVDREGAVFVRETIDGAYQDYEGFCEAGRGGGG
jgi:hypothetical protein